jgi:hypothetical protein
MLLIELAAEVTKATFCKVQKYEIYCEEDIYIVKTKTSPQK